MHVVPGIHIYPALWTILKEVLTYRAFAGEPLRGRFICPHCPRFQQQVLLCSSSAERLLKKIGVFPMVPKESPRRGLLFRIDPQALWVSGLPSKVA